MINLLRLFKPIPFDAIQLATSLLTTEKEPLKVRINSLLMLSEANHLSDHMSSSILDLINSCNKDNRGGGGYQQVFDGSGILLRSPYPKTHLLF